MEGFRFKKEIFHAPADKPGGGDDHKGVAVGRERSKSARQIEAIQRRSEETGARLKRMKAFAAALSQAQDADIHLQDFSRLVGLRIGIQLQRLRGTSGGKALWHNAYERLEKDIFENSLRTDPNTRAKYALEDMGGAVHTAMHGLKTYLNAQQGKEKRVLPPGSWLGVVAKGVGLDHTKVPVHEKEIQQQLLAYTIIPKLREIIVNRPHPEFGIREISSITTNLKNDGTNAELKDIKIGMKTFGPGEKQFIVINPHDAAYAPIQDLISGHAKDLAKLRIRQLQSPDPKRVKITTFAEETPATEERSESGLERHVEFLTRIQTVLEELAQDEDLPFQERHRFGQQAQSVANELKSGDPRKIRNGAKRWRDRGFE